MDQIQWRTQRMADLLTLLSDHFPHDAGTLEYTTWSRELAEHAAWLLEAESGEAWNPIALACRNAP